MHHFGRACWTPPEFRSFSSMMTFQASSWMGKQEKPRLPTPNQILALASVELTTSLSN